MTPKNTLAALLIGFALAAVGSAFTSALADEKRAAVSSEQQWLSIPQIIEKLEAAGYRNIEKIEREHGSYEVRATNRNGERSKLYVHRQTGEVISDRQKERKYERSESERRGTGSAECNERRCRDDLPQTTPAIGTAAGK